MLQMTATGTRRASTPDIVWTIERFEAEMQAAGRALRGLPLTEVAGLARLKAAWPDVMQEGEPWMVSIGRYRKTRREDPIPRSGATTADITSLDRALDWLWLIRPGDTKHVEGYQIILTPDIYSIVLAHALQLSWRKIARLRRNHERYGTSYQSTRRAYVAARALIINRLNHPAA